MGLLVIYLIAGSLELDDDDGVRRVLATEAKRIEEKKVRLLTLPIDANGAHGLVGSKELVVGEEVVDEPQVVVSVVFGGQHLAHGADEVVDGPFEFVAALFRIHVFEQRAGYLDDLMPLDGVLGETKLGVLADLFHQCGDSAIHVAILVIGVGASILHLRNLRADLLLVAVEQREEGLGDVLVGHAGR